MRFGLPKVVTSDQGREFNNELNTELMELLGIDYRLTTPYHPQSVQILHSGGNHWITISTVGTRHATVRIYDSLYGKLPCGTKETIASLIHTKERAITLEYANVQVSS